jgi:glutathione-specific gamma-glutamylcyclotransferase
MALSGFNRNNAPNRHELWVFGYGSLMWRPGFLFREAQRATLVGFRRCFCIYSTHHRGNPQRPGLVLGLDRGGVCHGMAYRVAPEHESATLEYLRAREQVNGVYRETLVPLTLESEPHRHVLALAYVVERAHPSYAGRLPLDQQARMIRAARGISGANIDYLINTLEHLAGLGIREAELSRVMTRIGPSFARGAGGPHGKFSSAALLRATQHLPAEAPVLKPLERRRFLYRRQISAWAGRAHSH